MRFVYASKKNLCGCHFTNNRSIKYNLILFEKVLAFVKIVNYIALGNKILWTTNIRAMKYTKYYVPKCENNSANNTTNIFGRIREA